MRFEQVSPEAVDRPRADRTLTEVEAHRIGVRIGAVYLGIVSQGVDPETARALTQDWVYSEGFHTCGDDDD